jgi:hypothetical protein
MEHSKHVKKMVAAIDNITCTDDIPTILVPFAAARGRTKVQHLESYLSCVSVKRIPFKTPSSLAARHFVHRGKCKIGHITLQMQREVTCSLR